MKKVYTIILFLLLCRTIFSQCYNASVILFNPMPDTGTAVTLGDDSFSYAIPIGFTFCFYGTPYDSLIIGSNAIVSFRTNFAEQQCTWQINAAVPNANVSCLLNTIMFPWQDLNPSFGGTITYSMYGNSPFRYFVVSFSNVPFHPPNFCLGITYTGQLVIYESTNDIDIYITSKPACTVWNGGRAIEAIQDITGTLAVVAPGTPVRNYPSVWFAVSDGVRFSPTCGVCVPTRINEEEYSGSRIFLSPNPATDELTIENSELKIKEIEIYNVLGEKIYSQQQTTNNKQQTVDISQLPSGIYILKVLGEKEERVAKFVKQ
jgi:hypothetical protein